MDPRTLELNAKLSTTMENFLGAEARTREFGGVLERAKYDSRSHFYKFFLDWKERTHYTFINEMLEKVVDKADVLRAGYRNAKALYDDLLFESGRPGFNHDQWVYQHSAGLGRIETDTAQIVTDHEAWAKQVAMDKLHGMTQTAGIPDVTAPPVPPVMPPSGGDDVGPPPPPDTGTPGGMGYFDWGAAAALALPMVSTALTAFVSYDFLKRFLGAHDARVHAMPAPLSGPLAYQPPVGNPSAYPLFGARAHYYQPAYSQARYPRGAQQFLSGGRQICGRPRCYHDPSAAYV